MTSMLRLFIMVTLSLCLAACEDRPVDPQKPALEAGVRRSDGEPGPLPPKAEACAIAVRVDVCCTAAQPVRAQELENDPCLVRWPLKPGFEVPAACKAKWTVDCGALDCTWMPGKTRLVEAVGATCEWRTECNSDADCTAAIDTRRCCSCPAGYPSLLVAQEPCLVPAPILSGALPPPACKDAADCSMVDCIGCPPPATPRCELTNQSALRRCTPWVDR